MYHYNLLERNHDENFDPDYLWTGRSCEGQTRLLIGDVTRLRGTRPGSAASSSVALGYVPQMSDRLRSRQ